MSGRPIKRTVRERWVLPGRQAFSDSACGGIDLHNGIFRE